MINKKMLGITKRTCKFCGRRITVKRNTDGSAEHLKDEKCSTCHSLGVEKSRESYLMIKAKCAKINYDIKKATDRPSWKKKTIYSFNNEGDKNGTRPD